jgi:hypothetical protein
MRYMPTRNQAPRTPRRQAGLFACDYPWFASDDSIEPQAAGAGANDVVNIACSGPGALIFGRR